ncbi:prohibitin family protein [Niveispirillum sp. KHB5.9]|uniref:prohibitin family protein n=1 Tax=Niveispirillum sp. KHB5.9 TaxID=3400269 RepID=UPI003A8A97A5
MTDAMPAPAATERFPRWRRLHAWAKERAVSLYALALTFLLALLAVAPQMVVEVPAGSVGVLWLRFLGGTMTEHVMREGAHLIPPWDRVTLYDVRLRNFEREYEAVAANGLAIKVQVALRYRVNPTAAGLLHKLAGPDYVDTLVQPEIASLLYKFVSRHSPENFYSVNREEIQDFLKQQAKIDFPVGNDRDSDGNPLRMPLIHVDDVLVSGVTLPLTVRQAIERKAQQEQVMQEYDFRIATEEKEKERKRIEAEGIRQFQDIVARTITPEYLRLRGIEATQSFATSTNAKTIIIGGRDGLPVILNTGDDGAAGTAPPAAAPAVGPRAGAASATTAPAAPTPTPSAPASTARPTAVDAAQANRPAPQP